MISLPNSAKSFLKIHTVTAIIIIIYCCFIVIVIIAIIKLERFILNFSRLKLILLILLKNYKINRLTLRR